MNCMRFRGTITCYYDLIFPFNVNRALSVKSKNFESRNLCATSSWIDLLYQLLASQWREENFCMALILFYRRGFKSFCRVRCEFWLQTLNNEPAQRFSGSYSHSSARIIQFLFSQKITSSLFIPLLCVLFFFYIAVFTRYFYRHFGNFFFFFQSANFVKALQMDIYFSE